MTRPKQDIIEGHTEQLLDNLGLLCARYRFEDIVSEKETRNKIKKFNTPSSKILRFSPTYFVMPGKMKGTTAERVETAKLQTFFIRLLVTDELSKDELQTYREYYKSENLLILYVDSNKKKVFASKLADINAKISSGKATLYFRDEDASEFFLRIKLRLTTQEIRIRLENYKKSIFG